MRLTLISDWAGARVDLTNKERRFLDASLRADTAERTATQRRMRRQRRLIAVLSVLVIVAAGLVAYAVRAEQNVTHSRDAALARKALGDMAAVLPAEPNLAAQLSLVADRLDSSAATQSGVIAAAAALTAVDISGDGQEAKLRPDARVAAVPSKKDDATTLLDLTGSRPVAVGSTWGTVASFSGDGRTLVSVDKNKALEVWDVANPTRPARLAEIPGPASGGAIDDQRHYLISGDIEHESVQDETGAVVSEWAAGRATLWDLGDLARPKQIGKTPFNGSTSAFGKDAHGVTSLIGAEQADNEVRWWRPGDPAGPNMPLTRPGKPGYGFRMSPSGRTAVTLALSRPNGATLDLQLWNLSDAGQPRFVRDVVTGVPTMTNLLAMNRADTRLAVVPVEGGTIDVWGIGNEAAASQRMSIAAPNRTFINTALSEDGSSLVGVAGTVHNIVEVWRWYFDPKIAAETICKNVKTNMTVAQWAEYFPNLPYGPPCI